MPFSQTTQLSTIVGFAERMGPGSVLDVGTGMGQYGFLLRNSLESLHLFEIQGNKGWQRNRQEWKVRIDGIEGFEGYLTPVHAYAYTNMTIGDALEILPGIASKSYDLVMAIDILEHFDSDDGRKFARECARIANRAALISTPKDFIEQHVEANPLEDHRSVWTQAQLAELGYTTILPNEESWIAVYQA
jgi:2-polyprenyl-3-methyl-5-hydroxy-6-metoxy-1,4-benzoquinol methylase